MAPGPESSSRNGLLGGLVLVGIGVLLLAAQFVPDAGRYVPLILGLAFLAAGLVRRTYGLVVPGGILTGVGAGVVLNAIVPDAPTGSLILFCLAGGFIGIWVVGLLLRLPENHWWPFVPATIIALAGLAVLDQEHLDALRFWPVVLVVIGIAVIVNSRPRDSVPPR